MKKTIKTRINELSPLQFKLFKSRLKQEGLDLETGRKKNTDDILSLLQQVEEKEYYELSSVQKRLFTISKLEGNPVTYNVPWVKVIEGTPDIIRLKKAFDEMIKRHDAFRTSFEVIDGEPKQRIYKYPDIKFNLGYCDLEDQNGNGADENTAKQIFREFIRPFDLGNAPLFRAEVVVLSKDYYMIMMDMHHIVSDVGSKRLLWDEFLSLYEGKKLSALNIQYKDFSEWQQREEVKSWLDKQEQYWLKTFEGNIPVLNLPHDFKRPDIVTYEGGGYAFTLDERETALLKEMASKGNTTLYVVVLALYNVFLGRVCSQEDIVVGTPVAGRRTELLNGIIGMFVNTLALRNSPNGDKTFSDFLNEVRQSSLDALENQDYPFEELVNKRVGKKRELNRNGIFDAFYTFIYPKFRTTNSDGLKETVFFKFESGSEEESLSMFDLFLFGVELESRVSLRLTYSKKLFKLDTIERMVGYFKEIVAGITENPDARIRDIRLAHDLGAAVAKGLDEEDEDFGF